MTAEGDTPFPDDVEVLVNEPTAPYGFTFDNIGKPVLVQTYTKDENGIDRSSRISHAGILTGWQINKERAVYKLEGFPVVNCSRENVYIEIYTINPEEPEAQKEEDEDGRRGEASPSEPPVVPQATSKKVWGRLRSLLGPQERRAQE